eukprot:TRINITY_DN12232_c0_g1_i3.p2 TRINITY_DN12232_c0_g1~~TRINITY_DN12232_c0_g1_i3.p2  ORF type:complete len:410 (+),score=53.88 TRINITY_DN12232_c0_g1_i3:2920-4149(+)
MHLSALIVTVFLTDVQAFELPLTLKIGSQRQEIAKDNRPFLPIEPSHNAKPARQPATPVTDHLDSHDSRVAQPTRPETHQSHSNLPFHQGQSQLKTLAIPQPSSPQATFFMAPHKTASIFIALLLHDVTIATGRCWYRIAQESREGVCASYSRCTRNGHIIASHYFKPAPDICPEWIKQQLEELESHDRGHRDAYRALHPVAKFGFVYGPIRINDLPASTYANLQRRGYDSLLIFHRRHPLDQIVSEFFSFAYSHPAPNARTSNATRIAEFHAHQAELRQQGVDAYALWQLNRTIWWNSRYGPYFHHRRYPEQYENIRIFHSHYETMVTDFRSWLKQLLAALKIDSPELYAYMLRKHAASFRTDGKHRRRVLPGAHKSDLRPATVARLWLLYGHRFEQLGYPLDNGTHV